MTQLHTIHQGIGIVRPTNDVDIVLHIETHRGMPAATATTLEKLGYRLQTSIDPADNTAHRFVRDGTNVDLVTSEIVDVLVADHPAPRVIESLRGREMVAIEGGTQALRRTVNARMQINPGSTTTISVPRPFGAVILKAAAYKTDSRDPERHLNDAAALLACIDNPLQERDHFAGSDRSRLITLQRAFSENDRPWLALPPGAREDARAALTLLCAGTTESP
jgi:hypothetical protein